MKTDNPFYLKGYFGPETFCNRQNETQRLAENMRNGRNTLLLSIRRMGKTGLILHTFNYINSQQPTPCLYVDLYATQNLQGFINQFAGALINCFPEKHSMGAKILQLIKGLRPTISYDPLSGVPEVSIAYTTPQQATSTIAGLLNFLEQTGQPIIVAFDEFQQIRQYPEHNTEALLRTYIQHLKNVQFIFSGSNKHLMFDIFNNSRQPFFASTTPIVLSEIDNQSYGLFIEKMFTQYKRNITPNAVEFILEFTRSHTYYTQALCNKVFAAYKKNSDLNLIHQCSFDILTEHEPIFYQYRQMLTPIQWALLKAIAVEGEVNKPHAKEFLQNHQVGTSANVQRALDALLKNEMLYRADTEKGPIYRVYNVFLSRWLERK